MPAAQSRSPWMHLDGEGGERAPGAEVLQLELERLTRIGHSQQHHVGRHDPAARGMPAGGDDGLSEHLAALDDGPPLVAAGDAEEGEPVVSGSDVHDVDEMCGIAPGREPLHRHVMGSIPLDLVPDLNPNLILIEGCVVGQLRAAAPPAGRSRTSPPLPRSRCRPRGSRGRGVRREPQHTDTDRTAPRSDRPTRRSLGTDNALSSCRDEKAQLIRQGGARPSPTRWRRRRGEGPCRRR